MSQMPCRIRNRTTPPFHYIKRLYQRGFESMITKDELLDLAEREFNEGRRTFDREGIDGRRFRVRLVSQQWHNRVIVVILENSRPCTLIVITMFLQ